MQKISRGQLAIAAVVVAFLAVAAWATLRGAPELGSGHDGSARLERIQALEAQLRSEQEATRRELDALRRVVAAGGAGPGARVDRRPPPTREQMAQHAEAQRRQLERVFEGLGPPPARDKAPQVLEQAFAYPGVLESPTLPESQQVECRATMCLVRAQFAPYKDGDEWATRVLMELAGTLPEAQIVTVPVPGGGNELRIYAARSGVQNPFGKPAVAGP